MKLRKQQVEIRVLDMCDAVVVGRNVEDDLVELKAVWPEAGRKVARQIAGHANAAGGAPILWVIGADERGRSLRSPKAVNRLTGGRRRASGSRVCPRSSRIPSSSPSGANVWLRSYSRPTVRLTS